MTTSGTYAFNPSLGELTLYAYNLIGLRNTSLVQEHFWSARMATNLMLANWANKGVNLWCVDLITVSLTQTPTISTLTATGSTVTLTYATPNTPIYTVGSSITLLGVTPDAYNNTYTVTASNPGTVSFASTTTGAMTVAGTITSPTPAATYSVNPSTVMILDAYITTGETGTATEIDRIILPVSRTEYASYPNKQNTGFPTIFWFDRLIAPTVSLWPAPDGNQTSLKYYRVRQVQDSDLASGQTVEIPYLWLDAFASGLASRLAMQWAQPLVTMLKPIADEAYLIAADQNVETANQYISPQISGYYR
jgi:hypothetical protein